VQTFVVRVFRSEHRAPAEDESLRGVVDEIGTGSRTTFSDAAQLLRILRRAAPPEPPPAPLEPPPETDRPATDTRGTIS